MGYGRLRDASAPGDWHPHGPGRGCQWIGADDGKSFSGRRKSLGLRKHGPARIDPAEPSRREAGPSLFRLAYADAVVRLRRQFVRVPVGEPEVFEDVAAGLARRRERRQLPRERPPRGVTAGRARVREKLDAGRGAKGGGEGTRGTKSVVEEEIGGGGGK